MNKGSINILQFQNINNNTKIKKENIFQQVIVQRNGQLDIVSYQKIQCIGQGQYSKCFKVQNLLNGKYYAAKIMPKYFLSNHKLHEKLINEIKIHQSLNHQHICKFETTFEDPDNVFMILELCENKSLFELLRTRQRLTEDEVRYIIIQLIQALQYLHQKEENIIIHRDLYLQNILLDYNLQIKIIDFSNARKLIDKKERRQTICGNENYIAPEIIQMSNGYSFSVDIWQLGITLYTLLIGQYPFLSATPMETYNKIKKNSLHFPSNIVISKQARDLILNILQTNPDDRPSLIDILDSQFLKDAQQIDYKQLPMFALSCPPQINIHDIRFTNITSQSSNNFISFLNNSQEQNWVNQSPDMQNKLQQKQNLLNTIQQGLNDDNDFVMIWKDMSSQYGLQFIMSNGCFGISFNDMTSIMADSLNFQQLCYIEKGVSDLDSERIQYKLNFFSMINQQVPKELDKKFKYLQLMKNNEDLQLIQQQQSNTDSKFNKENLIYIKRWTIVKHAVIFSLSNKTVQTKFFDKSDILIDSINKYVLYYDKQRVKKKFYFKGIFDNEDQGMLERLNYAQKKANLVCKVKQNM